jgi:hypothetical protein
LAPFLTKTGDFFRRREGAMKKIAREIAQDTVPRKKKATRPVPNSFFKKMGRSKNQRSHYKNTPSIRIAQIKSFRLIYNMI